MELVSALVLHVCYETDPMVTSCLLPTTITSKQRTPFHKCSFCPTWGAYKPFV